SRPVYRASSRPAMRLGARWSGRRSSRRCRSRGRSLLLTRSDKGHTDDGKDKKKYVFVHRLSVSVRVPKNVWLGEKFSSRDRPSSFGCGCRSDGFFCATSSATDQQILQSENQFMWSAPMA